MLSKKDARFKLKYLFLKKNINHLILNSINKILNIIFSFTIFSLFKKIWFKKLIYLSQASIKGLVNY